MRVRQTTAFKAWHHGLKDKRAKGVIDARMQHLEHGLLGDARALGGQLSELRVDYAPGYRLYFTIRGQQIVWLLLGGDKSTQSRDIEKARRLLAVVETNDE